MQIEKYEKRTRNRIAESTLKARTSGQRNLEDFIGGGEPTVEDVENWVDHLIEKHEKGLIKASTMREYYKAVKYYFEVVKGESETLDHISSWIPKTDTDPGNYLNEEEWEEVRQKFKGFRDRAFVEVMYFYARRPREVILLNKEDVKITDDEDEQNTITFNILKKGDNNLPLLETEDGKYRVFRATFELKAQPRKYIERWLDFSSDAKETVVLDGEEMEVTPLFSTSHGRISYNTVYKMIKQAVDNSSVEKNITPKGLGRHSRSTHLDWDGNAPGNIARDILLHDPDTAVIGRYIHDRDEEQVRETMTLGSEEAE